jgi:hypothetical protein
MSSRAEAMRNVKRAGVIIGVVVGIAGVLAVRAARRDTERATPRAEFGVLFGGDIQDRERFTLETDPNKQELGLRVTFPAPVSRPTRVDWEIEKPSNVRGLDGGATRSAELGKIELTAGESRADAKFGFRKGDLPGSWRVRVSIDGESVLNRGFEVVLPGDKPRLR